MELFEWDGWVSAGLSFVAILIGIGLAAWALGVSKKIARSQARMEAESYLAGRMQSLVDHARATVVEARLIHDLASARTMELLSFQVDDMMLLAERRKDALSALSRLEVEVGLLRVYATTMPKVEGQHNSSESALDDLMDEGAWLYSEALHAAILAFGDDGDDGTELSDPNSVVGALLNGSLVNLRTRLLSDSKGMDPDHIPSFRDQGSPWPAVYERRERVLLKGVLSNKSWVPGSLAEAAAWSLAHTTDRYEDRLMEVLKHWDALRA